MAEDCAIRLATAEKCVCTKTLLPSVKYFHNLGHSYNFATYVVRASKLFLERNMKPQ